VAPNAVNVEQFQGLPDKMRLRESLRLPPNAFLATYCGHLYPGRGVEDILACAAQVEGVRFLFVGGWNEDIRRRKEEASHLRSVTFTGFVANQRVPEYLAASDVLLIPHSKVTVQFPHAMGWKNGTRSLIL
jgi:glycosyltransferase involved in cell wall biosynthesis